MFAVVEVADTGRDWNVSADVPYRDKMTGHAKALLVLRPARVLTQVLRFYGATLAMAAFTKL